MLYSLLLLKDFTLPVVKSLRGASFTIHCTDNLKYRFPEMKLHSVVPNFYIHVSGSHLYIPTSVLSGISVFLYCVLELSAQPKERREGQGTAVKH
jgi:hypothetical protein